MRTLASFQGVHRDQKIVVCGCGVSLNDFERPERFITVGVNDVGRLFQPTYLVVCNWEHDFKGDRWQFVKNSRAQHVFTHLHKLELPHPDVVRLRHGVHNGTDFSDPNVLHYTNTSTYMALCLAVHMGARLIGIIGIDYTPDHFFGPTGRYTGGDAAAVDREFRRLGDAVLARGVKIFNLSRPSLLRAFPKKPLEEFATLPVRPAPLAQEPPPLRIVSYSVTPVAGIAASLARCINARTRHYSRCVWASGSYSNGIVHPGDIDWPRFPAATEAELTAADLVIVHNGKTDSGHRPLLANRLVLTMAHNYMSNVDQSFLQQGFPGVVIGQYQATLPEFAGCSVVPNPVPLWEEAYQPSKKDNVVTICYTPSGKQERSPRERPFFWHSKGYDTTMRILEKLDARFPLRLMVIRDRHVSHPEAMAMKRGAHIVIDECVTGSYHISSLEGLATGCVVVNGVGLLPGVPEVIRHCTGDEASHPFVCASLETLESVLQSLIERGPDNLARQGASNRQWMEQYWDFGRQWDHFWMPVIDRALHGSARSGKAQPQR